MRKRITIIFLAIFLATSLILIAQLGGCGGRPKIEQVHVGMTVEQVEEVLGEPIVLGPGAVPTHEIRTYKGDGRDTIIVTFEKGIAKRIDEYKWRLRWPTIG